MSKHGKIRFEKRCERYFVDIYWQGKRYNIYKYLGFIPCTTRKLAEMLLVDIRSEINKGIFNPLRYKKRKPLHLAQYSGQWLETLDVARATIHDYRNSLNNHILPKLGDEYLPDITTDKLKLFQKGIRRAPKGKKNVMDCLKQIMKAATISGHIKQIPEWPRLKVKKPAIRWISREDQLRILSHISLEDRYIFLFMTLTGCRPSEARAFRKVDIFESHIVFAKTFGKGEELKEVKGFNEESFPIHESLRELLQETPKNLTPYVFLYSKTGRPYTKVFNRIWNKACDDAGVMRIKLYNATRHSFACQLLNSGVDKSMVQRLLRHTDPKMTDRYAEYSTSALKITLDNVFDLNCGEVVGLKKGNGGDG